MRKKHTAIEQARLAQVMLNTKNPWTRKLKSKPVLAKNKDSVLQRAVSRWRLKQALRQGGLNHGFFTKKRTKARAKNYAEALRTLSPTHRTEARKIWG